MSMEFWKYSSSLSIFLPADEIHMESSVHHSQKKWMNKLPIKACFNSILLGTIIGLLIAHNTHFSSTLSSWNGINVDVDEYHKLFLEMGCNETIAKHLREITKDPHVAGTPENFATADYVLSKFQEYGLDVHYTDYQVLLSYPLSRNLSLRLPEGKIIQLNLKEKEIDSDSFTKNSKVIPPFHAYSPSGYVTAEVVYANYGREEDYFTLRQMGIDLRGAIVIAKYGRVFRGDIIQNAASLGAVGVVVYSDPQDYGGNRTEGYYPESRWLPPSGVERGSVFQGVGDPLTPGWPSVSGSERLSEEDLGATLPPIPSVPISAEDASAIIMSLGGQIAPVKWQGALDLPVYRLGRGPGMLSLHYEIGICKSASETKENCQTIKMANQTVVPIRNVFGLIKGSEEPDRYVLLGNHRDAWTFGAADPSGGTATLLEVAHRFGKLLKQGWQPRRSILFCSWDAEEYGLTGSTEWVEQNYNLIFSAAVAYVNVDVAVMGPGFFPQSTPQLDVLLQDVAKQVKDPDNPDMTIYQSWAASSPDSSPIVCQIDRLGGAHSDYTAFLQHTGVPAIDLEFGKDLPVYHSLYDDYNWMAEFGDPLFHRHVAVGAIWGLIALKLIDSKILPFNYTTYCYLDLLEAQLKSLTVPLDITTEPLHKSIAELRKATQHNIIKAKELQALEDQTMNLRSLNDQLLMAERAFTDAEGLPGKPWYKHLLEVYESTLPFHPSILADDLQIILQIYGPSRANRYGVTSFPSISDLIQCACDSINSSKSTIDLSGVWSAVQHEIWRVSRAISRAALVIHGEFT
eukprot:Gb_33027 [translate_table: standard]